VIRTFRPGDEPAIQAVVDAALPVDRLPGITRQDMVHAVDRKAGDPEGTLVAVTDETIVGYCTPRHDDLTVHPDHRRRGHGRRLVAAALDLVRSRGLSHLVLYGPADREPAAGFIAALGFTYHSSLWMFELAPSVEVPDPVFPEDVLRRSYRAESDLSTFVDLANASFHDHPTPLNFTERAVEHVHAMPDFDPAGILFISPRDEPDRPIAWAKAEHELTEGGVRRGYIPFVGVLPEWRGRGLGRELLRWAIANVRAAGAETIELSVEAANDRALGLYRRTGFTPKVEWPHFALPTGLPAAQGAAGPPPSSGAT
jgi:mycothiol synthase